MKKKIYAIVFMSIHLLSCSKHKMTDLETIHIDLNNLNEIINTSDYFNNRKIISLETTNESVLYKIDKLFVSSNKLFLLDKRLKSVLVFNENGNFLFKIHKPGKGPGEFQDITDFYINEKNKFIIISSSRPARLIYFDFSGKYLYDIRLLNYFSEFTMVKDHFISYNPPSIDNKNCVIEYSGKNPNKKKCYLPKKNSKKINFIGSYPHIVKNKKAYFTQLFDYNVYQLNENQVMPVFYIDYGKENIVTREVYEDFSDNAIKFMGFLFKEQKICGTTDFRETEDYFLFSPYPRGNLILLSKTDSKLIYIDKFYDKELGITCTDYKPHCGSEYNSIFFHFPAESFKSLITGAREEESYQNLEEFNRALKIADQINIEDNPVLIRYDFKP
jgi:hypothetical protein